MSTFREQMWNATVTVYRRQQTVNENGKTVTEWTSQTVSGVYLGMKKRQVLNGTVLTEEDVHVCRIPADAIDGLSKGDVICEGEMTVSIPKNSSAETALKGVEHFTADAVTDNRGLKQTAHWYAEG